MRWGDVVLRTTRARPGESVALGDGNRWAVPAEPLGVAPGSRASIEMGALTVDLEVISADERRPAGRLRLELGAWLIQGLSGLVYLGLLATLTMIVPRLRGDEVDAEEVLDRNLLLQRALDASAAREHEQLVTKADDAPSPGQARDSHLGDAPAARAPGEPGLQGNPVATSASGQLASRGPSRAIQVLKQDALAEASHFGIVGLLATTQGTGSAPSPWEPRPGDGGSQASVRAPRWDDTIADVFSAGGLGLSGTGEGGGGRANAIGLGSMGSLGRGDGTGIGTVEGMGGGGRGRLGGTHYVRIRGDGGDGVSINGRLPPEAIRRIVQQNMGRFRFCYEGGLERRPDLAGRVVTKFLVGRDGAVVLAVDAGSDLPDPAVVACVVRAFQTLSFPAPAGGLVTVEYPLAMTPE